MPRNREISSVSKRSPLNDDGEVLCGSLTRSRCRYILLLIAFEFLLGYHYPKLCHAESQPLVQVSIEDGQDFPSPSVAFCLAMNACSNLPTSCGSIVPNPVIPINTGCAILPCQSATPAVDCDCGWSSVDFNAQGDPTYPWRCYTVPAGLTSFNKTQIENLFFEVAQSDELVSFDAFALLSPTNFTAEFLQEELTKDLYGSPNIPYSITLHPNKINVATYSETRRTFVDGTTQTEYEARVLPSPLGFGAGAGAPPTEYSTRLYVGLDSKVITKVVERPSYSGLEFLLDVVNPFGVILSVFAAALGSLPDTQGALRRGWKAVQSDGFWASISDNWFVLLAGLVVFVVFTGVVVAVVSQVFCP